MYRKRDQLPHRLVVIFLNTSYYNAVGITFHGFMHLILSLRLTSILSGELLPLLTLSGSRDREDSNLAGMPQSKQVKRHAERTVLSLVLGDATALGLWVLLSSVFEELTAMLASAFGISPLAAGLTVLCSGLALYNPICTLVGGKGALFNPSQNFAFAAAGKGSFSMHLVRSVAQAVGGAAGAAAALRIVPSTWQGKFSNYAHGVMPGTSLVGGALAEGLLSFALNIAILWSIDTRYKRLAGFAPYIATIILVPLGAGTSGPFMNPAFAFSWFYHLRGTGLWEHVAVFWLGCLVGSYAAGLVWRVVTAPPTQTRHTKASAQSARSSAPSKKVVVAAGGSSAKKGN